jgi:hypothetical protein
MITIRNLVIHVNPICLLSFLYIKSITKSKVNRGTPKDTEYVTISSTVLLLNAFN